MRVLVVFGLVAALGTSLHAEPQTGVDLARLNGWDIVVGATAIPSERYAAEEFQRLFAEASGIRLPIVATEVGGNPHACCPGGAEHQNTSADHQ